MAIACRRNRIIMNRNKIIQTIGPVKFAEYSELVFKGVEDTGTGIPDESDDDIPGDVYDLIWESELTGKEKIRLLFEMYREIPTHSLIFNVYINWVDYTSDMKQEVWKKFRKILAGDDDLLAKPVEYYLWCGFFEDPARVLEAWEALVTEDAKPKLLERVLINSGPVPFSSKFQLYKKLISNPKWHHYIYQSVLHSVFDCYGKISEIEARSVLVKLDLPGDTENYDKLARRLVHLEEMRIRMMQGEHLRKPKEFYSWLSNKDKGSNRNRQ